MKHVAKKNRLILYLPDLRSNEARVADIWHSATGSRVLHVSHRPHDRTVILNDYTDVGWGDELAFEVGDASELKLSISLTCAGAIQVESNVFDPVCFLSRVPVPDEGALELECEDAFRVNVQKISAWGETGRPVVPALDKSVMEAAKPGLGLEPGSRSVLIVGSAPSVAEHVERIRAFDGDIWALNDALFWLRDQGVVADALFVNDGRFLKKREADINALETLKIVSLSTVDTSPVDFKHTDIDRLAVLGRIGFSEEKGRVYHGCSVYITAIQCAAALKYRHVDVVGVMFPPPLQYARVDATRSLPEYVFPTQIAASRLALEALRKKAVHLSIYEPDSNLHFL